MRPTFRNPFQPRTVRWLAFEYDLRVYRLADRVARAKKRSLRDAQKFPDTGVKWLR